MIYGAEPHTMKKNIGNKKFAAGASVMYTGFYVSRSAFTKILAAFTSTYCT